MRLPPISTRTATLFPFTTLFRSPPREEFPVQGLSVSAVSGPVVWNMVKAQGVDFVYIRSSSGAKARDAAFATNLEGARAAGMRYGPIPVFNLCDRASDQATLFLSTVPRDNAMLPPVVRLSFIPKCTRRPPRAPGLRELHHFLNTIEAQ